MIPHWNRYLSNLLDDSEPKSVKDCDGLTNPLNCWTQCSMYLHHIQHVTLLDFATRLFAYTATSCRTVACIIRWQHQILQWTVRLQISFASNSILLGTLFPHTLAVGKQQFTGSIFKAALWGGDGRRFVCGTHTTVERICKLRVDVVRWYPHFCSVVGTVFIASKLKCSRESYDRDRMYWIKELGLHLRLNLLNHLDNVARDHFIVLHGFVVESVSMLV